MFRYIAIVEGGDAPGSSPLASDLRKALIAGTGWQPALEIPGLAVYCVGAHSGINEPYLLHRGRGVVLGRLFHRSTGARIDDVIRSGGRDLVENYWGRYVAFFESGGEIHVLRDPSGALPCFLLQQDGATVVFSWLDDVIDLLPQIACPTISVDGLAGYMAFGELTGRRTALEGVTQVLAGERVTISHRGQDRSTRLWSAGDVALKPLEMTVDKAAAGLRTVVNECAAAWAGCYESILLRLSGGVDSSILASCLVRADRTLTHPAD